MEKKTCFLLVFHGSKRPEALAHAHHLQAQVAEAAPQTSVHLAFLQFAAPLLPDALQQAYQQGFTRIVLLPMLLLPGFHSGKDIPEAVSAFRERCSDAEVVTLPIIGQQKGFAALVATLSAPPTTAIEAPDSHSKLFITTDSTDS